MKRCHCCGGLSNAQICSTCIRDAQFDTEFTKRVERARIEPQVCLQCGWSTACRCTPAFGSL